MIIPVRLAATLCRPMMGLVALFAVVGICSAALNAQDAANRETTKISVASPQLKTVTLTQRFLGQVHAQRHIRIRALQKGYLEASKIKEGQQVNRGDTLFSVIPILYQKRAEAAQAKTMLAQLELQAAERSYANKVVSQYEVRLFEAKLRKVQAEADLAKAELGFATVKAPFDGIIGRPQYQEGSLVLEGDTLATLSDNSAVWVYFHVPETLYLEHLQVPPKEDMKIELMLANGKKFDQSGKLGAIDADFNSETGGIAYRADFPNPDLKLRHGQRGTVLISGVQEDSLVIPQRATFEVQSKRYVYVVDEKNVVHQREIVVQNELDDLFVIKKGDVGTDDKIIVDGVRQVHDGDTVVTGAN